MHLGVWSHVHQPHEFALAVPEFQHQPHANGPAQLLGVSRAVLRPIARKRLVLVPPVTLPGQLSSDLRAVGHELCPFARAQHVLAILPPGLEPIHALIGLHHFDALHVQEVSDLLEAPR